MTFKNFEAASRKRNIVPFGLLTGSVAWIEDNVALPSASTVAFSSTPVFDVLNGAYQMITLTGDIAPVFKYAGSVNGTTGATMTIRFEMSGGPWNVIWPPNFNAWAGFQLGETVTIITVWWNGTAWEGTVPPVENPA